MNELIIIIIILGIGYLSERRAERVLINYIGLIIVIAILITQELRIEEIGGQYISYILIMVQVGAVSLLFGIIIMIYPKSTSTITKNNKRIQWGLIITLIIILSIYKIIPENINISEEIITNISIREVPQESFLEKLGESLYKEERIKLMGITIILLLGVIGLFYIL